MHLASLVLLLIGQAPAPDIDLVVPEKSVPFARSVKMKVLIPPAPATDKWDCYTIEWDVTERRIVDNPLENDLDVDSAEYKASIPSGAEETSVKIKVAVIFIYKDDKGNISKRVARATKYVQIGTGTVVPRPPVVVPPVPGPVPPPGPGPGPPVELFGMTTWTSGLLQKSTLSRDQAKLLGEGFHQIANMAKNGAFGANKDGIISAMAEKNRNVLGVNADLWVEQFLKPLQIKINPMNPRIKTVADQAQLFHEIGYGLEAYGSK